MSLFPLIEQPDAMDCGPACLCMIAKHYGKNYTLDSLRRQSFIGRDGVSLLGISRAAEKIGFRTVGGRLTFEKLVEKAPLPCIAHWNQDHFVVVYKTKKTRKGYKVVVYKTKKTRKGYKVYVADPGKGLLTYTKEEFCSHWISTQTNGEEKGVVLILEPSHLFYEQEGDELHGKNLSLHNPL